MTGETAGRRRHEHRLNPVGAREVFATQIDVRVHHTAAEPLPPFLPLEPNTWIGWENREFLWLGPDEWLVTANPDSREPGRLIPELEILLAGTHHSIVDVSAARAVIEMTRDDRHGLLAQGCSLDLDPRFWSDGMCAQTLLARAPVILQERETDTRVFVRPSYAGYLVDWLVDAAGVGI